MHSLCRLPAINMPVPCTTTRAVENLLSTPSPKPKKTIPTIYRRNNNKPNIL